MWTTQLRPKMLIMSQMRSDARCFEYGEHIRPHARHPPEDQDDKWAVAREDAKHNVFTQPGA